MKTSFKQVRSRSVVWIVLIVLILGGLFAITQPVEAQTCMNDNFNLAGNRGTLNCTAKEVFIEENSDGSKIIDAMVVGGDGCAFSGDTATVDIIATLHFNADRFDVGIYSALDGGDGLFGSCGVDILVTNPLPATDFDGDYCGDVDVGDPQGNDLAGFTFQTLTLTCEDTDRDGFLDFSTCFSWRTSGNNEVCNTGTDVYPGTKSKCFCERVNIPVEVPPAELQVTMTANPSSVSEPGGSVTYMVTIKNTGIDPENPVTLNTLIDNVYGDLFDENNLNVPASTNTCINMDRIIEQNDTVTCQFVAEVSGNADDTVEDTVFASGTDIHSNTMEGSATAVVTITDVPSAIDVLKSPEPASVDELGGNVEFTFTVINESAVDVVTINSLMDEQYGDLNGKGTCSVPQELAPGESYTCSATFFVESNAGDSVLYHVTASGVDDDGNPVSDFADAVVTISDVMSKIDVIKSPKPASVNEPGGNVAFTFTVINESAVDVVTINSLVDDQYGDMNGKGTCSVPQELAPGMSYTCTATFFVGGNAGDSVSNQVTASGVDDDGAPVSDFADAVVIIDNVLPAARLTETATSILVTYEVVVCNDSNAEALTLNDLYNDIYGDISSGAPNQSPQITETTCVVPQSLAPAGQDGDCYNCTFKAVTSTSPTTDTVTGIVDDDDGSTSSMPSDSATVTFE